MRWCLSVVKAGLYLFGNSVDAISFYPIAKVSQLCFIKECFIVVFVEQHPKIEGAWTNFLCLLLLCSLIWLDKFYIIKKR
jgi:hypothetical protein